jgi:heptosyltransferase-3
MRWFEWLGLGTRQPPPLHYAKQPDAREWVEEKVGTGPYVTIHPAAIMETKRWAASRFREVGRMLNERGWRVVVTAGPGEEEVAREAARDLGSSLLLLGLSIPQLAELIRGAVLYIGNDSGPMHLASAVGTPCIAIWGSSNADRWRPWHVPHRVVQNPFECNPCAGYRCHVADSPLCIESVTVDQVGDAISSLTGELGKITPATINLQDNLQ